MRGCPHPGGVGGCAGLAACTFRPGGWRKQPSPMEGGVPHQSPHQVHRSREGRTGRVKSPQKPVCLVTREWLEVAWDGLALSSSCRRRARAMSGLVLKPKGTEGRGFVWDGVIWFALDGHLLLEPGVGGGGREGWGCREGQGNG